MTETPYRSTYRVEQRIRPLTPDEEALVRERLATWCERRAKHEPSPALELSVAVAVCIAAAVFGALRDIPAVLLFGVIGAVFLVGLVVVATRRRRARLATVRGPWHAPEGGWQVCDSSVFARSIVGAASGDEDYSQWTLFEIPGGTWFFVEHHALPDPSLDLAREHVSLARLWPGGEWIAAASTGASIPRHGARNTIDSYPEDEARGWVWNDEPDDDDTDVEPPARASDPELRELGTRDLIREDALPEWMREVVRKG